ncbi:MAG: hypothetical protein ACNI3C_04605 [Candidatus Marinarcus sp.]|uniref:hypothetical protein n=1 Tax=Candidatus Marinarcus sp. TaxID=3100987 RepID=UPI003B00F58F
MNIELRFLQKAIQDKNFVNFSYEDSTIKKSELQKITQENNLYYVHTQNKIFEYAKIKNIQILKEKFN